MQVTNTITILEILIVAVCGATFVLNLLAVWDVWKDVRLLQDQRTNGVRRLTTNGNLRNELARAYRSAGFLIVGVIFMTIPNGSGSGAVTPGIAGYVLSPIFFSIVLADLGFSLIDRKDRKEVLSIGAKDAAELLSQAEHIEQFIRDRGLREQGVLRTRSSDRETIEHVPVDRVKDEEEGA